MKPHPDLHHKILDLYRSKLALTESMSSVECGVVVADAMIEAARTYLVARQGPRGAYDLLQTHADIAALTLLPTSAGGTA